MNLCHQIHEELQEHTARIILGQERVTTLMLVALLAGGHVLLEGVPGTGKTLLVRSMARLLNYRFQRIQFTPDLMPSDITGTNVFDQQGSHFYFKSGPVFTNLLLADEINRTPPKTQSALMEAMEEKQVTIDGVSYNLPIPFTVFATQNPLEHQGTYPLPEAQLDRFMLKVFMGYPEKEQEKEIIDRYARGLSLHDHEFAELKPLEIKTPLEKLQEEALEVTIDETICDYIMRITLETREDQDLYLGASSRAAIHLLTTSRVLAALRGKSFVSPDEVKELAKPVLRHRLIPEPEAEVEGITTDEILEGILTRVQVPR